MLKGFIEFIKSQGIMGLAIAFILGAEISKVVSSLVNDILNPLIGLALPSGQRLQDASFHIGRAQIQWGSFAGVLLNFAIIAFIIYMLSKLLGVEAKK